MNPMTVLYDFLSFFLPLFAITAPLSAIPIFISLSDSMTSKEKRSTINMATFTMGGVLVGAAFGGSKILSLFGASIDSFRVAGGCLLFTVAFNLMTARPAAKIRPEENQEASSKTLIGPVPLGVPILAGPGAISMTIIFTQANNTLYHFSIVGISVLCVCAFAWITLTLASPIGNFLGRTGINISNRILGMLVAAVAIEFIATGAKVLLPGLGK